MIINNNLYHIHKHTHARTRTHTNSTELHKKRSENVGLQVVEYPVTSIKVSIMSSDFANLLLHDLQVFTGR